MIRVDRRRRDDCGGTLRFVAISVFFCCGEEGAAGSWCFRIQVHCMVFCVV